MIVTCPTCGSKYRVRNEAVPTDGARMRCPKCDTLFLAKPPAGSDAQQQPSTQDDPSSMYQQLNPATNPTGPNPRAAAAPAAGAALPRPPSTNAQPAPVPPAAAAAAQAGPITALFQAFDAAKLPPEAQRPPPPAPAPAKAETPSGLQLDDGPPASTQGPKIRIPSPQQPAAPRPSTAALPDIPRLTAGPSRGAQIGSWVAVVAGGLCAVFGVVFWAWTSEVANLDAALMPMAEQTFGRQPPRSVLGHGEPTVDELRTAATDAMNAGNWPRAVVLWRRVKARDPSDARVAPLAAKCLSELGDIQGAP